MDFSSECEPRQERGDLRRPRFAAMVAEMGTFGESGLRQKKTANER
jgi:hypothetical protein